MMRGVSETEPHILVVDDHRDIRELLARYLAKHSPGFVTDCTAPPGSATGCDHFGWSRTNSCDGWGVFCASFA